MAFSEPLFLFGFLPLVLLGYVWVPRNGKNAFLAGASLLFYAIGEYHFLGWLLGSTALNYLLARGIEQARGTRRARRLLLLGICSDLALLAVFKYADFLVENLNIGLFWLAASSLRLPHLALPLGISFFTFHKISYKVDVYRGTATAHRRASDLLLYILLFPQLIAGPIIRYHDIADELRQRSPRPADVFAGARRLVLGLGKKLLLADAAAQCVDQIFGMPGQSVAMGPSQLSAGLAWLAALAYTAQIYFDFSGYSDMAVGLGRMFGFHFPENFNFPYAATSITAFWRRWHMSLSRWFRDYLYIPLGGNRHGPWRTCRNLACVFLLCGLWHGAAWTFVFWGAWHGGLLGLERLGLERRLQRLPAAVGQAYALLAVVWGWVLFRAEDLSQAGTFWAAMLGQGAPAAAGPSPWLWLDPQLCLTLLAAGLSCAPQGLQRIWGRWAGGLQASGPWLRRLGAGAEAGAWGTLCLLLFIDLVASSYSPFIYFRF